MHTELHSRVLERYLENIAYRKSLVLEMIARAASGRTLMPQRDAERRLLGIIQYQDALRELDRLASSARYVPQKVRLTGATIIDRVAKRREYERKYARTSELED